MGTKTGIVMKIEDNIAHIFTSEGELTRVRIQDNVPVVGEEYTGIPISIKKRKPFPNVIKPILFLFSILIIILIGNNIYKSVTVQTYIDVDMNCHITLEANKFDKIISASAFDNNSEAILNKLSIKNKTIDDGLSLIFDKCNDGGYFSKKFIDDNGKISILITSKKDFIDMKIFQKKVNNKNIPLIITKDGTKLLNQSKK